MPNWLNYRGNVWLQCLALAFAGGAFALGFAPLAWWPLSLVALALLFISLNQATKTQALLRGLSFGLGQFGVGVSWVYVSMVNFGNMPPPLAIIAVILMTLFLAAYPALAALSFALLKSPSKAFNMIFLAPACWLIGEALRGYLFTGFPWLLAGYSGIDTWLAGYAPIGGVLLLSLLLGMIAGLLGLMLLLMLGLIPESMLGSILGSILRLGRFSKAQPQAKLPSQLPPQLRLQLRKCLAPLFSIAIIFGLGAALKTINWTEPTGDERKIGIVQLHLPLQLKWQDGMQQQILRRYLDASAAVQNEVDLLIWPEGALPQFFHQLPTAARAAIEQLKTPLVLGTLERREQGGAAQIYNSMVLLDAQQAQFYRKTHLVPFGEFFPLKWLLADLLAQLQVPMSNMTAWPGRQAHLSSGGFKWLPTICYEDAFAEDWRAAVPSASAILNISEDAWFGDSFAPHQRLEMGRMRALEMGREMVRASNSGLSTVVRTNGAYGQITPQFQASTLRDTVRAYQGETPYVKLGRMPIYITVLLIVLFRFVGFNAKISHR